MAIVQDVGHVPSSSRNTALIIELDFLSCLHRYFIKSNLLSTGRVAPK